MSNGEVHFHSKLSQDEQRDALTDWRHEMSEKTGGAGGGGKQNGRKAGNVKGGGRNKEQDRRASGKLNDTAARSSSK
jgi:hypothetical protein